MKHVMDFHEICKCELEGHNINLFVDGEWIKLFLQRFYYFDVLL